MSSTLGCFSITELWWSLCYDKQVMMGYDSPRGVHLQEWRVQDQGLKARLVWENN